MISAAAVGAINTGATEQAQAKREAAIAETLNPAQPLALPAPVAEKEKLEQQKVDEYLAGKDSTSLTDAQRKSFEGEARGHNLVVVPHPSGKGYTTIPASKLSDRQQKAVQSIQRPDQGQLPSPQGEMPGQWVAPEGRTPEPRTYGDNNAGMRAEMDRWRTAMGTPVPKQMPIDDEKRAAQIAERKTQETGREHKVVAHPMSATKFAVAPVPTTIDAKAERVQDSAAFTGREQPAGVNNASQEAAVPQPQSAGVANDQADGAGAPAAAGPSPAAEAPQAEGVAPVASTAAGVNQEFTQPSDGASGLSGFQKAETSPAAEIAARADEAATSLNNDLPQPSAAQAAAGNYKKGHVKLHGLDISIENPAGSVRVAKDGSWASAMPNHYGYIKRTEGNDGDHVDTFIGPKPESKQVFIVDQLNPKTGEFDEHKVMLGFDSQEAAEAGYKAAYPADWKGMGTVTATTVDGLKEWVKGGDTKAPFAPATRASADMVADSSGYSSTSLDFAARPVTTADPKQLRNVAHLFGQPAMRVVDIDGGKAATEEESKAIAAIVQEAARLGLPEAALDGLRPIAVLPGTHNGIYWFETRTIALTRDDLLLAARGNKWASITNVGKYVHEVMHHITGDDNGGSFASKSPAFAISRNVKGERVARGSVISEAYDAWAHGKPELKRFLDYPLKNWGAKLLSAEHTLVLQDEVMAQIGRIYYTNPRLLRLEMPKAFAMMEGLHNEVAVGGTIDATRDRVRKYLRAFGTKVSDRVNVERGSGRSDQEGAGGQQAGAGLGGRAVRESASVEGDGGRAGRGDARLAAAPQAGTAAGQAQRLTGAPEGYEPSARAQQAAREYMKSAGLPYSPPTEYVKVDPARAARIAQAYADMKHEPGSMPVKAAYATMIRETLAQWKAIEKTGLKVTFATAEKPYPYTVPGEVFPDVNENNHMWVFPTVDGFGSDASVDVSDNPLLEDTGIVIGGHKLVANDVFRIVHDYFGHIKNGVGFRANGEENAWRAHAAMYSPLARRAMTSETRGQNSWLNWGPHGEKNRTAKTEDTIFADQKTGLLPEWVSEDNYAKRPGALEVRDNEPSVTVGVRPGMYGWNFAQADKTAPPVAVPSAKGPRLEVVAPKINEILSAPGVRKLINDLYGVSNVKVKLIFGSWKGVPEPSYVLTGKGMTFDKASDISKLLGFAFAQDAAIASEVSQTGQGVPSSYIGSKTALTEKQKASLLEESVKAGLDLSSTPDGKGVAYLYFGEPDGLDAFHAQVAKIADAVGLPDRYDFATRSSLNESQGYTQGSAGEERGAAWLHSSAGGPSAAFKRAVDHLVVPYAKAVGAEGYRFSPERFAARFGLTPAEERVVREALLPKGGKARSTAGIVYGDEKVDVQSTGKRGRTSVLDVMWALQNRAAETGLIEPGDHSPRAKIVIASTIADEVAQHIQHSGKSAIGWYDRALKQAKKTWQSVFPSIATDPNQEMVFDAVLGITSQGNPVDENAVFAARVFDNYQRTGKLSTEGMDGTFGEQTRAIEGNIAKLKTLIDANGFDRLRKLMNTRRTVGEWNAILRKDTKLFGPDGAALQIEGAARQKVTGWFVFGPKIGSFINNLHGDYSTLTADLWFTRTWNRILGYSFAHVPESEADSYARFQEELLNEIAYGHQSEDTEGLLPNDVIGDPESMVEVARKAYDKFVASGFKDKSPLRRAAKGWIERRESPLAAPRSSNERAFQQDVVEAAQRMIKGMAGIDITVADIQAALWYHEKELFKKLGAGSKKSAPADYADAAQALVDRYNAGDLYYVKSTGTNLLGDKGFYLEAKRPAALEVRDNEPLWYSQLATAVESKAPFAKDGTIPAGQLRMWLAARSKDGGIKAEELKWSGLDEFLSTQDGRVSRDDVKSFLDQNGVKITETTLGEAQPPTGWTVYPPNAGTGQGRWVMSNGPVTGYGDSAQDAIIDAKMKLEREARRWQKNGDEEKAQRFFAQADEFDAYMEARAGVSPNGEETTKFSSYQLPGGENYRELLLTLPTKQTIVARKQYQLLSSDGEIVSVGDEVARSRWLRTEAVFNGDQTIVEKTVPDTQGTDRASDNFRSSHFEQPNILAHIRFNERTDAEGKRVLFLEEIQSDWAQKGRKEGFRKGAPAAPFVAKTEAWVALALKRMIRYAADNGFDRIAWTNGEQQAERYDLSKQVREVHWGKGDGGYSLTIKTNGGMMEDIGHSIAAEKLPEYVGKEVAQKIVDSTGRSGSLSGLDLKVGGEGMRAFYDRIVPNVANDLLKKMGGGRVVEVRLSSGAGVIDKSGPFPSISAAKQPGFDITPDMEPAARRPQAMFVNTATVTNAVQDLLTTSRSFNLWDRTVGTQLNKALKNPMFAKVYNGVQAFLNDSSQMMMEAADLAPDLLPKLDGLGDIFKRGPSKADLANVSSAVFDGTINDVVYSDAELRTRGLNDKQIGFYRQARAAIDKSLSDAVASEAVKQAKGLLPQSVLDQAKAAGDAWIVVNALSALRTRSAVQQQVYDQLRARAAEVSDLQTKGYAPLQRFGQYTVHVTNPDGSSALFTMHESEREANAFARAARASLTQGQTLTQGVMSQEAWKLFQGVSPDTLQIFAQSIGASQSQVMQSYIKLAANNRSVLKRMLQRKEIAGFQTDIQRTLAQFITSNARAAAKNYHWGAVLKAANDIPKELGDVKDEAIKLKDYMETAKEEAGALRGLLFIQFLGGSVASAITNATQPMMMTFPWLAQFGGAAKAAAQLTRAGKIALGGTAMEPGLRAAMDRATKEGIVAPHEVAGLYAESIRNFGSNMAVRRGLKVWGSLFSLAEGFNRRITFVAAYRTAVEQNMADPYEFATRAIAETQGVYNRGNRPNWARGAVGATLFTFKQYSVAYVEMLNRLPAKQKAVALAVLVLASGLQGLPGADDLEDVIDTIAESLGYSFNSKKQLREWAARTLGDTAGGMLTHGFSALPGVPIDVQARLGLGNLIPGTGLLKRSETDKSRDVMEFFGPAGSQAQSFVDAFSAAQEGNTAEIFKAGVPLAIKNALKGLDMAQSGFYKDMKGRRVMDVDAYDAMMKGIGFQPQNVAKQTRVIQDVQQDINLAKDVEIALGDRMARAIVEHDPDALQKARVDLFRWNQDNPQSRIQIMPSQIQRRVRELMSTREQRFVKASPKEMRVQVREELRQ
ncbi:MAG TPA: PLxRFG domain-containing protein [Burkholderiaceae bacterium]|nr:PLxRFG domain-containing protein [Burkholderiaceae bacterium]